MSHIFAYLFQRERFEAETDLLQIANKPSKTRRVAKDIVVLRQGKTSKFVAAVVFGLSIESRDKASAPSLGSMVTAW